MVNPGRFKNGSPNKLDRFTVADPGFPRGGDANSQGGCQYTILPIFTKKMHEIERIWTGGGFTRAPLGPPIIYVTFAAQNWSKSGSPPHPPPAATTI